MDNVCHTLVGAAIGEAGLKHRTRFANAALMVAANVPDIDVLVFATDLPSVSFRRGWTHGVGAQLLLPFVLTGVFLLAARRQPTRGHGPAAHAGWLLTLSFIGVYSHVFLDYLNNYGVRLLTPFDWRWFYGDAVFIIDPWLWLALGIGIWLARRRRSTRPSLVALAAGVCYIVVMLASARAARSVVVDVWRESHGSAPRALMVGPVPFTPLAREIIVDAGDHYQTGSFAWLPAAVTLPPTHVAKNADRPEVAAAVASSDAMRAFLTWSRFPFWTLEPAAEGTRVTVQDMRFRVRGRGFTVSTVVNTKPAKSASE
jgi:inner membrane protein